MDSPSTPSRPKTPMDHIRSAHNKYRPSSKHARSSAHDDIVKKIHSIHQQRAWLIDPVSDFMKRWDVVMIVCLIFTAAATPYEVSFLETKLDALFFVNRAVDLLFLWDMGIQFFLSYENELGETITDHRMIAGKYLRTWFFIDVVSICPFDIVGFFVQSDVAGKARMLRVLRLLRLAKLLRVVRANRILQRWESQLGVSFAFLYLVKALIGLFSVAHWGACLWHLAAVMVADEGVTTWIEDTLTEDERTNGLKYSYSLWYSFAILFSGEGPIGSVTTTERMTTIAMTIVFGSLYAYVIGSVCGIVSSMDLATKMFQQSMDHLNLYLEENKFPQEMRVKLRTFFNRAKQLHRSKFYHDTLSLMSPDLRREMSRHVHAVWMEHISFLATIPDKEKGRFLSAVAMELRLEVYGAQEKLINQGEFTTKMYIVQKGLVARLGRVLGKGRYVGEDMILHSSRRHYSVVTLTFVDIQSLAQCDLEQIMQHGDFPLTRKIIRRSAISLCLKRYIVHAAAKIKEMDLKGIEVGFEDIGRIDEDEGIVPLSARRSSAVSSGSLSLTDSGNNNNGKQAQFAASTTSNTRLQQTMVQMQSNVSTLTHQLEQSCKKQSGLEQATQEITGLITKLLEVQARQARKLERGTLEIEL